MSFYPKIIPGLKEDQLIKLGPCCICGKPQIGSDLTFYKLTISRAMFDTQAISRRVGLQMMLGNSDALARAMGPNEDIAKLFDGPHEVFVHEQCAHQIHSVLQLMPKDSPSDDRTADGTSAEVA